MKKKLEDYSCFIKRITGAFSLKSIHRCAKVTMLSFFTLVAVPCASFAQTNPKDIRNADDLTDAFKPANVNSWDQLNITADISGSDTHNGTPPAGDAVFLLEGYSSTITNRTFTGVGERRTLSYGSSSANKDGRLFGYYGINGIL